MRVKEEKVETIKEHIVPGWGFIHNYASHILGRIWICWDPKQWLVVPIQQHDQVVSCEISSTQGDVKWIQSVVYGSTKGLERRSLWQYLITVKNQVRQCPWLLAGDFNVLRSVQEK